MCDIILIGYIFLVIIAAAIRNPILDIVAMIPAVAWLIFFVGGVIHANWVGRNDPPGWGDH